VDILNVGRMDVDGQQEPVGIGDNVPLAPMEALAGIKSTWPASLRRRGCLAVDDGGRRLRLVPEFPPACRTRTLTILCHLPVSRHA